VRVVFFLCFYSLEVYSDAAGTFSMSRSHIALIAKKGRHARTHDVEPIAEEKLLGRVKESLLLYSAQEKATIYCR
jgi:hypothetical protein